ncbi:MAG: cobalamin biosynthesis protein CobW [Geminicoccaceae bacterium]
MSFTPKSKIPTTVFTGFLGAGKTSLVQNMLRQANGRRIALIVNEFGDIGVDRELLLGCGDANCSDEDIVELANGCICCTVADDFVPTMQALLARDPLPDHIVIETSGLALPKPLIKAFNWPEIKSRVTVDGVVSVVDAAAVRDGLFATDPSKVDQQRQADDALDHESPLEELFEEQLGAADLVIANKADLVEDADWSLIEARIQKELRPGVRTVRAFEAAVPLDVLIGQSAAAEDDLDSRKSHHDNGEDHEHDDFTSFHVEIPEQSDPEALITRLKQVVAQHRVLRVKGFVDIAGKPMRLAIQGVGDRIQHYFDRPWKTDEPRQGKLVVIGEHDLNQSVIIEALTEPASLAA